MATMLDRSREEIAFAAERVDPVAVKALVRTFAAWRVGIRDGAQLAGVSERTWSRMRSSDWSGRLSMDQRLRASALVGLYKALHLYFSDSVADRWVKTRNSGPLFRGMSPVEYMTQGGLPAILQTREYMDAARGGV